MSAQQTNKGAGSPEAKDEAVTEIVARGRTVNFGGKSYSANAEVTLPASEAKRLRGMGFLVDPEKKGPNFANGPTWSTTGGPRITRG